MGGTPEARAREHAKRRTPEYRERRRAKGSKGGRSAPSVRRALLQRHRDERPFIGVDGEGAGTDAQGRQLFMLLRAGEHELFTGRPLSTVQCLRFLANLPKGPIYVGFSIGYDITMMLRDLPPERVGRLLNPLGAGRSGWTFYEGFAINWLPKNHFRVARAEWVTRSDGTRWQVAIKGTSRTFYETFGFFQSSFLKALHKFGIGTIEQRETIERNKAARGGFAGDGLTDDIFCPFLTAEERDYCALECDFLAQLMDRFRGNCIRANLRPRTWNGAGKLGAALHAQHETMRTTRVAEVVPAAVRQLADLAYYGGRFEVTRVGPINDELAAQAGFVGPPRGIYEADIHSAYPYQMTKLPCLEHGTWEQLTPHHLRQLGPDDLYIAPVRFRHVWPADLTHANLCGLPIRKPDGRIFWPMEGRGVYWSTELRGAAKLGCRVVYTGPGWVFRRGCDCRPFAWLAELYAYRQTLGASLEGEPIKYGINSCYGKLVQRVGDPVYANLVWGGLITAGTRAMLMDAAASNPEAVLMLATDGIFSLAPLKIDVGDGLGQWEQTTHGRLFICQPGIYFGGGRPKTRGVSPSFFNLPTEPGGPPRTVLFERAWAGFRRWEQRALSTYPVARPSVWLPLRLFVGTKLAYARKKLETAGMWVERSQQFRFDWTNKRGPALQWEGERVWTFPAAGGPDLVSQPGGAGMTRDVLEALELDHAELDDQPDWLDLSPD